MTPCLTMDIILRSVVVVKFNLTVRSLMQKSALRMFCIQYHLSTFAYGEHLLVRHHPHIFFCCLVRNLLLGVLQTH
jgi:hypothetical protein